MTNQERHKAYLNKFEEKLRKEKLTSIPDTKGLIDCFIETANIVSRIPYLLSSVDILELSGFKFTIKLDNSKVIMVSRWAIGVDPMNLKNRVTYSLFVNKYSLDSGTCHIRNLAETLNEYL